MMMFPRGSARYGIVVMEQSSEKERIAARQIGKQRQKNSRVSLPGVAIYKGYCPTEFSCFEIAAIIFPQKSK
jgi:hypothetical protein